MKILVIGGTSFSGRWFIRHAEERGDEVAHLSRPNHDLNGNLPERAAEMVRAGYEHVINFAALNVVAESWGHAADYYRTNVAGVARLASFLGLPIRRFVQVSTPEVYGTTREHLKESEHYRPSTPYAVSRAAADMHLMLLHRQFGFPVLFTRTVNVYGPEQQLYRLIPKAALAALTGRRLPLEGGGVATRSFIHIRDAVAGYYEVLVGGKPGGVYHLATPLQTSIRALVALVCAEVGVTLDRVVESAPERPGKDMAYQLDDFKIRCELDWTDKVGLEAGVAETVGWVRQNLGSLSRLGTEYRHVA